MVPEQEGKLGNSGFATLFFMGPQRCRCICVTSTEQTAQLFAFSLCTGKQFFLFIHYSQLAAAILQIQYISFNATMRLRCRFFPLVSFLEY